jgi:hypothetical protein
MTIFHNIYRLTQICLQYNIYDACLCVRARARARVCVCLTAVAMIMLLRNCGPYGITFMAVCVYYFRFSLILYGQFTSVGSGRLLLLLHTYTV